MNHPLRRWAGRWTLAAALMVPVTLSMVLLGCDSIAYVGNAFHDDRVPPRFSLPAGNYLVLVDDPDFRLGDPSLSNAAAAWAGDSLRKNTGSKVSIVPVQKLVELAQKTGQEFASMPVDQVGSELGATHVIYVFIEKAGVSGDPGLYRPRALVRVNVLEVATGRRIFPAGQLSAEASSAGTAAQGEPVEVLLHYSTSDQNPVAETSMFMRQLAQQIGVEVAKVFYKHDPPKVPRYND